MKNRTRVGLIGYYGFGNYGDELFRHVLNAELKSCDVSIGYRHNSDGTINYDTLGRDIATKDVLLIGGGDLVIPYALSHLYWREEYLARPVVIYGVGVPKWGGYDADVVFKMREFFQHPSVHRVVARDLESREWIETHLKPSVQVEAAPDIVCSYNPPDVTPEPKSFGIVLRHQSAGLNRDSVKMIVSTAQEFGFRNKVIVLGTGSTKRDDLATVLDLDLGHVDIILRDSEESLTKELLKCSRVASMKFHGCVVAMANGVPSLALSSANKFKNFYEEVGRPEWVSGLGADGLESKLREVLGASDFEFPTSIRNDAQKSLGELDRYLMQFGAAA